MSVSRLRLRVLCCSAALLMIVAGSVYGQREGAAGGRGGAGGGAGRGAGAPREPRPSPTVDGDFTIRPAWANAPELIVDNSIPHGTLHKFTMKSEDSKI